ncbi:MAG: 50S ribosomal protein L29 [Candidatus Thermoplasmatota archaeon]|nr:50S ribosomal protein L29 [Candidatus Thermoplasmatota archaeon]MED5485463.1 50S ribosomal protein L29 [Candidatus Thermoplasmatota archaeon]MEE3134599.1 50S ribosomal protein L29 [Candidatus Thermoplasmatota archaeon]|tara:strand:- start:569 stop:772 length:204 start_codon:yes stop_codon:yes gene_type:complete
MTHLHQRDIDSMSEEARVSRLKELQEELLQLRAELSLGGRPSNMGAFRTTRRSIARLKTKMQESQKE